MPQKYHNLAANRSSTHLSNYITIPHTIYYAKILIMNYKQLK